MRKLLNNPWVVVGLACAALGLVARTVLSQSSSSAPPSETALDQNGSDASSGDASAASSIDPKAALKEMAVSSLRDPFVSRTSAAIATVVAQTPEPDLTDSVAVSAVWIQNGKTYLLVNNQVRQVGDQIGRITLESATREGVWLRHWKGRNFVSVGGAFILVTPAREAAALSLSSES